MCIHMYLYQYIHMTPEKQAKFNSALPTHCSMIVQKYLGILKMYG